MHRVKLQNEKGFTLIEMLLVLFITISISSLVFKVSFQHIQSYSDFQLIHQLQLKIREVQYLAHANKTFYYIFGSGNEFKVFQSKTDGNFYEQKMPDNINIVIANSHPDRWEYYVNSKLEFNAIGDFDFKIDDKYYIYNLNIGKGRVTVGKAK